MSIINCECFTKTCVTAPICSLIDPSSAYIVNLGKSLTLTSGVFTVVARNMSNGAVFTQDVTLSATNVLMNVGNNMDFFTVGPTFEIYVIFPNASDPQLIELTHASTGDKAKVFHLTFKDFAHNVNGVYQISYDTVTEIAAP